MIRVVVGDDQTLVRQGIRGLLELMGDFDVIGEAEDGDDAIAKILELRPDVALLDVRMPGTGGLGAVRALREKGDQTPIVLLTTFDDDAVLLEAVRAGVAGFLLKDVDIDELASTLRAAAAGKKLVLPAVSERTRRDAREIGADFAASELPEGLTPRELEVLRLIAGGFSNREIARALGTAEGTVKNQASSVLSKLGVRDRTRAVLKALELGWLAPHFASRRSAPVAR
jgi:DNA-binding NarL/FixJ family response regulator